MWFVLNFRTIMLSNSLNSFLSKFWSTYLALSHLSAFNEPQKERIRTLLILFVYSYQKSKKKVNFLLYKNLKYR